MNHLKRRPSVLKDYSILVVISDVTRRTEESMLYYTPCQKFSLISFEFETKMSGTYDTK